MKKRIMIMEKIDISEHINNGETVNEMYDRFQTYIKELKIEMSEENEKFKKTRNEKYQRIVEYKYQEMLRYTNILANIRQKMICQK